MKKFVLFFASLLWITTSLAVEGKITKITYLSVRRIITELKDNENPSTGVIYTIHFKGTNIKDLHFPLGDSNATVKQRSALIEVDPVNPTPASDAAIDAWTDKFTKVEIITKNGKAWLSFYKSGSAVPDSSTVKIRFNFGLTGRTDKEKVRFTSSGNSDPEPPDKQDWSTPNNSDESRKGVTLAYAGNINNNYTTTSVDSPLFSKWGLAIFITLLLAIGIFTFRKLKI